VPKRDGILYARVHALPAGRAVHVSGVSCKQHPTVAVSVGYPVVDPEPGTPDDLLDLGLFDLRAARVQQPLHVRYARAFGCFIQGGYYTVPPSWKRRHHDQSFRGEEQHHLVVTQRRFHSDIGEHKRFFVCVAGKTDSRALAHNAVHAIGADDISRADFLRLPALR
jgi:hypothetical protein